MSDKPQGPGWWLASDGTWHPPELHPSVHEPTRAMIPPATGPEAIVPAPAAEAPGPGRESTVTLPPPAPATPRAVPSMPGTAKRPAWSGESDRRAEAGPMYPDLFKQAVSGSRLADAITVNFTDGERRDSLGLPTSPDRRSDHAELVSSASRTPAEVGEFTGASARKRWRRH